MALSKLNNTIKIIFISIFVLSCNKKNETVEIEILSNEVKCVFTENKDSILNNLEYQKLSFNIVDYKIKNNSNEKYFFCIDDLFFTTSEEAAVDNSDLFYQNYGFNVGFNIINNDKICSG